MTMQIRNRQIRTANCKFAAFFVFALFSPSFAASQSLSLIPFPSTNDGIALCQTVFIAKATCDDVECKDERDTAEADTTAYLECLDKNGVKRPTELPGSQTAGGKCKDELEAMIDARGALNGCKDTCWVKVYGLPGKDGNDLYDVCANFCELVGVNRYTCQPKVKIANQASFEKRE